MQNRYQGFLCSIKSLIIKKKKNDDDVGEEGDDEEDGDDAHYDGDYVCEITDDMI